MKSLPITRRFYIISGTERIGAGSTSEPAGGTPLATKEAMRGGGTSCGQEATPELWRESPMMSAPSQNETDKMKLLPVPSACNRGTGVLREPQTSDSSQQISESVKTSHSLGSDIISVVTTTGVVLLGMVCNQQRNLWIIGYKNNVALFPHAFVGNKEGRLSDGEWSEEAVQRMRIRVY